MAENKNQTTGGGVGILGVILIVFIILKATNNVDWPWVVVLIPLWISLGLLVLVCCCTGCFICCATATEDGVKRKQGQQAPPSQV